jgi:hypothetical protein
LPDSAGKWGSDLSASQIADGPLHLGGGGVHLRSRLRADRRSSIHLGFGNEFLAEYLEIPLVIQCRQLKGRLGSEEPRLCHGDGDPVVIGLQLYQHVSFRKVRARFKRRIEVSDQSGDLGAQGDFIMRADNSMRLDDDWILPDPQLAHPRPNGLLGSRGNLRLPGFH